MGLSVAGAAIFQLLYNTSVTTQEFQQHGSLCGRSWHIPTIIQYISHNTRVSAAWVSLWQELTYSNYYTIHQSQQKSVSSMGLLEAGADIFQLLYNTSVTRVSAFQVFTIHQLWQCHHQGLSVARLTYYRIYTIRHDTRVSAALVSQLSVAGADIFQLLYITLRQTE